jgi:hypothetical protein
VGNRMIGKLAKALPLLALTAQLAMAQSAADTDNAQLDDALKALDAAEAAHQAAWDAVPLTIRKGIFVEGPATGFGSYVPREDTTFAPGEKLHLYLEPVGFAYRPQGRLNAVELAFDLAIYDESGKELFKQEGFSRYDYQGRAKVRELYVDVDVELTGFPPNNNYVIGLTARDLVSGEMGEFRSQFRLTD